MPSIYPLVLLVARRRTRRRTHPLAPLVLMLGALVVASLVGGRRDAYAVERLKFFDDFTGSVLSVDGWTTPSPVLGLRWCPDDGQPQHTGTGVWKDMSIPTELCHGMPDGSEQIQTGAVSVSGGEVHVVATTSRPHPFAWRGPVNRPSPFPKSGDFALELKMRYDDLTTNGTGFSVQNWAQVENAAGTTRPPKSQTVFEVWGDSFGLKAYLFGQSTNVTSNVEGDHTYRLAFDDRPTPQADVYTLYIDGVSRLTAFSVSHPRPNAMWFGNPSYSHLGVGTDWSDFSIDYVKAYEYDDIATESTFGHCKPQHRCITIPASDPVDTATGAFVHEHTDVSLPGVGVPFILTRSYTSLDAMTSPLGQGWTHSLNAALYVDAGGATLRDENGRQLRFASQPGGSYVSPDQTRSTLAAVTGGFDLTNPEQTVWHFDAAGVLQSMVDTNGKGLALSYTDGRLTQVTDSSNRTIVFTYNADQLLEKVQLSDGRYVQYSYTSGRLTSVTDLRGKTTQYTYTIDAPLAFDGIDDHVRVPDSTDFDNSGRITLEAIVRIDALGNYSQRIVSRQYQATNTGGWYLRTSSSAKFSATFYDTNGVTGGVTGTTTIKPGTWYHVAATLDSGVVRLYVNGIQEASTTFSPTGHFNLRAPFHLGQYNTQTDTPSAQRLDGHISEARVWTAARTAAQIAANTQQGALTGTEAGLAGYWKLTAGTGASVQDSGLYDNDGQMLGGGFWPTTPLLTRVQTPLGNTEVANVYDTYGRVIDQQDAFGNRSAFTNTTANGVDTTALIDARGKKWSYAYQGNVIQQTTDPNGVQTVYAFDADLNLAAEPQPGGNPWTMTYDAAGNLLTRTAAAPLSYSESFAYDSANRLTSHTDTRNFTTAYEYDVSGDLTKITQPGNRVTTITPDPNGTGLPVSITDPRNKTWAFEYDGFGNLTRQTSPEGLVTEMTYDAAGNMLTRTDPRGVATTTVSGDYTTVWTYDPAGNVLTETNPKVDPGALDEVTNYEYDDAGHLIRKTDARNKIWRYQYNVAGELEKTIAPDSGETIYTYDQSGNLLTETDAENGVTSHTYDNAGRLASRTDPRNKTTTYTYDAAGNLLSETSAEGNKTGYTYDILGRRTSRVDPRGNVTGADPNQFRFTYTYDGEANLLSETDPLGNQTEYSYDFRGNELARTDPADKVWTNTYDAAGNLATETDPLNRVTAYGYDDDGPLVSITDPRTKTTSYGYDGAGNRTSETSPLGSTTTSSFDALNRLTSRVDGRGNVVGADPDDFRWLYDFDPVGNLLKETDPLGHQTQFEYDAVGNRNKRIDAKNRSTIWTFDTLRRTKTVTAPDAALTSYTYDPVGNLKSRTDPLGATSTLDYDGDGRLVAEKSPAENSLNLPIGFDALGVTQNVELPITTGKTGTVAATVDWTTTNATSRSGTLTGSLNAGGTNTHGVATYGKSVLAGGLSWASADDTSTSTISVPASTAGSATQTISHADTGTISAQIDWQPVVTGFSQGDTVDPLGNHDYPITVSADGTANATLSWSLPAGLDLDLYLLEGANVLASDTALTGTSAEIHYAVSGLSSYPSSRNLVVRVHANTTGSLGGFTYSIAVDYPVTPAVDLKLEDSSGTTVASSSLVSGLRRRTLSHPNAPAGTYTLRASSSDYAVPSATLTETHRVYAPLTLTVKDASNAVIGTPVTSSTGTLSFSEVVPSAATNTFEVSNGSAEVATSSYTIDWKATTVSDTTSTGSLAASATASPTVTADGAGDLRATLTWTDDAGSFAPVQMVVKDSGGTAVGDPMSGSTGSLVVTRSLPSSGTYTIELTNQSSTLAVPSYTLVASVPDLVDGAVTLKLKNSAGDTVAESSAKPAVISTTVAAGSYTLRLELVQGAADATIQATYPAGFDRTFSYDAAGNLLVETDPRGNATSDPDDGKITRTYDNAGRLTAINYSDSTPDVTYTNNSRGLRETTTDGAGTETRTYDAAGQLISIARTGQPTISYDYDEIGNVKQRSVGGSLVDSVFDDDGRLWKVTADGGTTVYTYDEASNHTATTLPNTTSDSRVYDNAGRLKEIHHLQGGTAFADHTRLLDQVGNPSQTSGPDGAWFYGYDNQDRITCASRSDICSMTDPERLVYEYDLAGNRTSETRGTLTSYSRHDKLSQLLMLAAPSGITTYGHDAAGNMTRWGDRQLGYDLAGRTISDTQNASTFSYDADGNRTSATFDGVGHDYVWDPSGPMAELATETNGGVTRTFTHGLGLVAQNTGGTLQYAHAEFVGGTTALTDSSGALDRTYTYEPFGATRSVTAPDASSPTSRLQFTGEYLDPTGLYHLRARQFAPTAGRFLAPDPLDPIHGTATISAYAYAANRPGVFVDPSGRRQVLAGTGDAATGSSRPPPVITRPKLPVAVLIALGLLALTSDPPGPGPHNQSREPNRMTVQLQDDTTKHGSGHTREIPRLALPDPGWVTVAQMQNALEELWNLAKDPVTRPRWFPFHRVERAFRSAIITVSRDLKRYPPGGVRRTGNILTEEFGPGDKFRIDIENKRGHNLRS